MIAMDLKAIGRRIKAAREVKGLTQEALAELVNLSPMHVSVIERGYKPTKMDTFCNIANVLDVPTRCSKTSSIALQIPSPQN